jgi:hypothetical protein
LCLLVKPLVSSNFGHCVLCHSLICVLWLLLWYLQTFGHCVLCPSLICSFCLTLWYLQTVGHCVLCPSSICVFWFKSLKIPKS